MGESINDIFFKNKTKDSIDLNLTKFGDFTKISILDNSLKGDAKYKYYVGPVIEECKQYISNKLEVNICKFYSKSEDKTIIKTLKTSDDVEDFENYIKSLIKKKRP
ncbi:hypothetical protein [Romboutsia sp. 1001713B170131_170501_G6]|uniref:hypothetical protein n=1 Tax=Romboutsia sp. 1001713B170131_170501_G6 TaxID=2787108 RepID=UPI0018AB8DFE|nr:hypothetical protein [Romboutsia sp. 1001713B170131_170501_G6]